jgi:hypothetical protein
MTYIDHHQIMQVEHLQVLQQLMLILVALLHYNRDQAHAMAPILLCLPMFPI